MQMAQKKDAEGTGNVVPGPVPEAHAKAETLPSPPASPVNPGLWHHEAVKEIKTADELAAMILGDLRQVKGCPQAGVNVTVYGLTPWNSWLSFGAAAGPVYDKAELQEFCVIITDRLKRLYDISE